MNKLSSYDEIVSSGNDYESSATADEDGKIANSQVTLSDEADLPLVDDEEDVENDPVEEFVSDQEDALSYVSDFTNKESIHVFSQSQKSILPNDSQYVYATQEEDKELKIEEEDFEFRGKAVDDEVQYIFDTQEEQVMKAEEKFEFPGKLKIEPVDEKVAEVIRPEDFLYSQKSAQLVSQQIDNALDSALSIIKRDTEEYLIWQRDVDWKINRYGSVINAYHDDESVHILRVIKSWVENSLVFARCSLLEKEQVDTMIQSNTQVSSSFSTENDTVQDFPEPLPPPPIPAVNDTEVDVLFIFSFAMNPNFSIEAMKECKVVAVWEPTFDVNDIVIEDYPDITSVSTITRFKIVA